MERGGRFSQMRASTSVTAASISINEDPFSVELERLDIFEVNDSNTFMKEIIDSKKSLIEDAKLARKLLRMDELATEDDPIKVKKVKKLKPKAKRRHNIDDDLTEIETNTEMPVNEEDANKADEETDDDDEVQVEDDIEEENDYMDSYFDNGEEFAE